jgi:MFS family permease
MARGKEAIDGGWRSLLDAERLPAAAVLVGGVLLHSMNVLLLATILPTIVGELGGAAIMHWPTTAFVASSLVAATCTGMLTGRIGLRATFCAGALVFAAGAAVCSIATAMGFVIAGRFVQGFGGGLLTAVAYVLVRLSFPEQAWPRALALLSGTWSVSILIGPLIGGAFVRYGDWRSAFVTVAAIGVVLALGAFRVLPAGGAAGMAKGGVPVGRVVLICFAIAGTSLAAVATSLLAKPALIAGAIATLALMVRIDRRASSPLLPRDAFSLSTPTGLGLWLALLLAITFSPLQIYVPIFLQRLHGLDPLAAGYAVTGASFGWTVASVAVAGVNETWRGRLILLGPLVMAAGLMAVAWLMPLPPGYAVVPAIVLVGVGIGISWVFVAQRTMSGARPGDETVAASSVATVQQMGFAVGAALAGLVANASGLEEGVTSAAVWVPSSFVVAALLAFCAALRLRARS